MISRYTRGVIADLWSEQTKYEAWLEVELAAVDGWADAGVIPADAAAQIRQTVGVDVERAKQIEQVTHHDVGAFVRSLAEQVDAGVGRWIHFGLTSSDIVDTASAIRLRRAAGILLADVDALMAAIKRRAFEHKRTPKIGRSHGIHAEPTTLGHTLAVWYAEMSRHRRRLEQARQTISYAKISGSVGTFQNVAPSVEAYVCEQLGLTPAAVSTQIIQRDRHAEYMSTLAQVASSLEKFAVEVRHMQRTEVGEAREAFGQGQQGSSSMPHKRNPVLSENITGLARTIRGYLQPALENVALWHERDISHSSVERVVWPDATGLLDFGLVRMTKVLANLVVDGDRMRANLGQTRGLPYSQRVLSELIGQGLSRQDAYERVQSVAMVAWDEQRDFEALVRQDPQITGHLSDAQLDACFDLDRALRHIDAIFERVFDPDGMENQS